MKGTLNIGDYGPAAQSTTSSENEGRFENRNLNGEPIITSVC